MFDYLLLIIKYSIDSQRYYGLLHLFKIVTFKFMIYFEHNINKYL